MAEPAAEKLPAHLRDDLKFKPGRSGNPSGRPKGSRNKLGEAFLEALHADFTEHGKAAIEEVRSERPHEYLKVIASTIPKELNVKVGELDELDDEQLSRQFRAIVAQLAAAGVDLGTGDGQTAPKKQAGGVSSIH